VLLRPTVVPTKLLPNGRIESIAGTSFSDNADRCLHPATSVNRTSINPAHMVSDWSAR